MRRVGLHVFCSVKGGVGKSTLSVLAAKLLAAKGRVPVLVDTDMLGTSLADGLKLCAPKVKATDGFLDLEAPPTNQWYSLTETRELRTTRKLWLDERGDQGDAGPPVPPAYLNDALHYPVPDPSRECAVAALLWRHQEDDGVWYLPSSPLLGDAMLAAPYGVNANGEYRFIRRLTWVLDGLLSDRPRLTDVVLDLPPGTWGFSHEVLMLLGQIAGRVPLPEGYPVWSGIEWLLNPFIVTSRDRNDRLVAIDYFMEARRRLPRLIPLCNRLSVAPRALRDEIKDDLPAPLKGLGIEELVRLVPELSASAGRVFVAGNLNLGTEAEEMRRTLRLDLVLAEGDAP